MQVVLGQLLELFTEIGQFINDLLSLNQVTRVQIIIIIEVQHLEHETRFDNGRFLKERDVKLLDELVKV